MQLYLVQHAGLAAVLAQLAAPAGLAGDEEGEAEEQWPALLAADATETLASLQQGSSEVQQVVHGLMAS
jgi:hypothetical protein